MREREDELSHEQRARIMKRADLEAVIRSYTALSRSDKVFAEMIEAYSAELILRETAELCGLDQCAAELLDGDDDNE